MIRRVALALVLAACTEDVQLEPGSDTEIPGLVALDITPADTDVFVLDVAEPTHEVALIATGAFVDGSSRDVTDEVAWTADHRRHGGFTAPGLFVTSNAAAGVINVRARSGAVVAEATITIDVTQTLVDSAFPPPPGSAELFDGTEVVDAMRSPAVIYPPDGVMFPPNIAPVLFQLDPGMNNEVWRLRFESALLHLTVYTTADRWLPDATIAQLLGWSSAGGTTMLTIAGVTSTQPGNVYTSAPIELRYAADDALGYVSFRADASGGIVAATLDRNATAPLFPVEGDGTCAGCHAVSRDGRRMATGLADETLHLLDLPSLDPTPTARKMGGAAFSPDGRLVVVADKGKLRLLDAATGSAIGDEVLLPAGLGATHPDWAPSGDAIVVALGEAITNRDLKAGRIARIPFDGAVWGAAEMLVDSTGDNDNNFFPRYAPDGSRIAYVHADSPARGASTAQLRMIPAGGGTPVTLARASPPDLGSSMPTWAPGADDVAWLAFTSMRTYGLVLPDGADAQIWVTAIDLEAEGDPSFAAFWLPSQDPTQRNYLPCWASAPLSTDP